MNEYSAEQSPLCYMRENGIRRFESPKSIGAFDEDGFLHVIRK